jgi:transcriptional regulator with XRE-family HTH domain
MAFSKKKLKEQRMEKGWTLDDLATRAGLSKSYLSQLESGKERKNPTTKTIEKLSRAFEIPLSSS